MKEMKLDFVKSGGIVPAIVQDSVTGQVLMLGYLSPESLKKTLETGRVTFYSRSRHSLWTKGETSGNYFDLVDMRADCDQDAVLIQARPHGPACHRGTPTCFVEEVANDAETSIAFLSQLEQTIAQRMKDLPEGSYVSKLTQAGLDRMAQKVGEEGVETVIAAKNPDRSALEGEAADLVFHLMVLLKHKGSSLGRVAEVLRQRHK